MTYFQTTPMTGDQLALALASTRTQDAYVLGLFQRENRPMTPSEVHEIGKREGLRWPVQSARRSITTLTDDGALVRLAMTRCGPWGKPEHYWALPATDARIAA